VTAIPAASLAFSAHAPQYTALRRRLVPRFDAFYGAAVDAVSALGPRRVERVLDLGAGTGLFTAAVAVAHPAARFDLLDGSAEMLEEAKTRLAGVIDAVHVQDMAGPLPAGPYDAVISAMAIHHLEDDATRSLFARVHEILAPDGIFVNAEQVAGPTPALAELYRIRWAADVAAQGASQAEIAAAEQRRGFDRCRDVESQLIWLREAGFATADCVYKYWETAVLVARDGA
jgi:tRNA (cmo5U34)-methyltransferase